MFRMSGEELLLKMVDELNSESDVVFYKLSVPQAKLFDTFHLLKIFFFQKFFF